MDVADPKNNYSQEEVSDFSLKEFFTLSLRKWYWILLCLIFAVGIALFYIYTKQPEYKRYEQILVNNQDSNGGVGEVSNAFATLGLFSKNTNVYNELLTLTSPSILYQIADTLQLDMNYMERDGLRSKTLYGTNLPFRIDLLDIDHQGSARFRIKTDEAGNMNFYKFERTLNGEKIKYEKEIKVRPGISVFNSPLGRIQISPNPKYQPNEETEAKEYRIFKMPMQTTVELFGNKLNGDLADQDADVIELTIEDVSVERANDILNYVLLFYNQDWINDKNKMAIATSAFIDERLKVIQEELGDVDETIAQYMKKTGTPNLQEAIRTNLELGTKVEGDLIQLSNELSVAQYMKDFLAHNDNITTILPVNLGIESADLVPQITAYNEMIIARNNILNNSSESNPIVENYNQQLMAMRGAISKSVDNRVATLQKGVSNLQAEIGKMTSKMADAPELNLPLLSEGRQQTVKEALYLFLLQKREENELTMKFSADNVRVITPPIGPLQPVSPKKGLIIIIAVILGVGLPLIILYYLESSDNTIKSRKDLERVSLPFAGEIPQVGRRIKQPKANKKNAFGKKKDEKPPMAVVEEGKRDVVNEAFRVIRGNIDFMSGKNSGSQVIMLTSFNPGSGKSFIAYNLALSFCLKNKKVLIIDCDLRHGSSSMFVGMPGKGLTNYLTGNTDNWESLIVRSAENPNLSIMPIGKMPPNPAELLEGSRLGTLIEEARKDYDIIFLDCPPVNIVVDTQLVSEYADRTLFVVRAGLLEKPALKELNEFYEEKKFKNMSVILNGTEAVHSRYYTYGNYQNLN